MPYAPSHASIAPFTRPNDTTTYTAADVVGGVIPLYNIASVDASSILLTSASLEMDINAVPSGMTDFRLYLYRSAPPSALADNAAWDLPAGDRAAFLGYVDLGVPVDLGSTLYVEVNSVNKQVKPAGAHMFGYLVTNAGYTPTASAAIKVTLYAMGL